MLVGKQTEWNDTVFYEFDYLRCIRTPEWKYIGRFPAGPHELNAQKTESAESRNLFGEKRHAKTQAEMQKRLAAFFMKNADPKYDLWRDGKSQTRLLGRERFPGRWYPPK